MNQQTSSTDRNTDTSSSALTEVEARDVPAQPALETAKSSEGLGSWDEINAVAKCANTLMPQSDTWGFFAFSDGPVVAGGGTGSFLWFASHEEMCEFISRHLPLWCPGPAHSDPRLVATRISTILSEATILTDTVRQDLNQVLRGYAQLEWCGRFGDLLSKGEAFERKIRSWYWKMFGHADASNDVPAEQSSDFAERLREYGI